MQQNFLCPACWKENTAGSIQCKHCGAPLGIFGTQGQICPNSDCRWPRKPSDLFCGNCGMYLPPICSNCGNTVKQDSRYCPRCSYFCGGGRQGLI